MTRRPTAVGGVDVAIDVAGGVLVILAIAWTTWAAARSGGDAGPVRDYLLLVASTYAIARTVTLLHSWAAAMAVVLWAGAAVLTAPLDLLRHPVGGPLGYSNATGAFCLLAAVAAGIVAVRCPSARLREAMPLVAAAFAAVPWLNGTLAAAVLSLLLVPAWGVRRPVDVRRVVAGGGACFAAALLVSVLLAVGYGTAPPSAPERVAMGALSERRVALWYDAVSLLTAHPVTGVGVGRFPVETRIADPDARWAHHSALQMGAETGVLGLVLVAALLTWGFVRLWSGASDRATAFAAVGLTAVAVHSCVDYVLGFPQIGVAVAVLLGVAVTTPLSAAAPKPPRPARTGSRG